MPAEDRRGPDFIGTSSPDADLLARSLEAGSTVRCPGPPPATTWAWDWADLLETWSTEIAARPAAGQVVVCTWPDALSSVPLLELDAVEWRRQVEWPTALWFSTMVGAASHCSDGGSLVVVVDRPATLDTPGHGAAVTVAEGVTNAVRSLAAREGGRGVRVNAVVTALHTDADGLPGAPPPLVTFPGRIDVEVAGAVRLLLSDDAVGITGTALPATAGRR